MFKFLDGLGGVANAGDVARIGGAVVNRSGA